MIAYCFIAVGYRCCQTRYNLLNDLGLVRQWTKYMLTPPEILFSPDFKLACELPHTAAFC